MPVKQCGDDRNYIRAVTSELITEKLQSGELQAGLYNCANERLGQWSKVALCADVAAQANYTDCNGNALATDAKLATCQNLNDAISDVPKIVSFSPNCADKKITATFNTGDTLDIDLSCFMGDTASGDDKYVSDVSIGLKDGINTLTITRNDGVTFDVPYPTNSGPDLHVTKFESSLAMVNSDPKVYTNHLYITMSDGTEYETEWNLPTDLNTTNVELKIEGSDLVLVDSDGNQVSTTLPTVGGGGTTLTPAADGSEKATEATPLPTTIYGAQASVVDDLRSAVLGKPDIWFQTTHNGKTYIIPGYEVG